jgi:predicted RNA binding protein YcfA (HicA-like mRNA interferase family)
MSIQSGNIYKSKIKNRRFHPTTEAVGFPTNSRKEVIAILKDFGFRLIRQSGTSHAILGLKDDAQVVVPVTSKDLPRGTLHSIIAQAESALEAEQKHAS